MLTPDFAFCHIATVRRWLGRGVKDNEYGPSETLRCRVNFKQKKVHWQSSSATQEVVASGTVFFPAGVNLKPEDEIVFAGNRHTVLSAMPCYDCFGNENHVEVDIQ